MKNFSLLMLAFTTSVFTTANAQTAKPEPQKSQTEAKTDYPAETQLQKERPGYYNTAIVLREAWWMMEPSPKAGDEQSAESNTSTAYEAIQKAGINYSSKLNAAGPPVSQEIKDHKARWQEALRLLNIAKAEINKTDGKFSPGLKESVAKSIDTAIEFATKAIAAN